MKLQKPVWSCLLPLFLVLNVVESKVIDGDEPKLKLDEKKAPLKAFTAAELAVYDGSNPDLPIYLAIKGVVFDVSEGKAATSAFVSGVVTRLDLSSNVLINNQVATLFRVSSTQLLIRTVEERSNRVTAPLTKAEVAAENFGGYYGKGAGYNALAGKDCTRAVAKWSLEEKDMTSDVTGLTQQELVGLDNVFNDVYRAKYPIVGHMAFNIVRDNATPLHRDDEL